MIPRCFENLCAPSLRLYFLEGIPPCNLVNNCEGLEAPAVFISRFSCRGVSYTALCHVGPLPCAVQGGYTDWKVFRDISQPLPSLLLNMRRLKLAERDVRRRTVDEARARRGLSRR